MYETSRARLDELVRRGVDACATYPLTTLEPKDAELFVNHRIGAKGSQSMTLVARRVTGLRTSPATVGPRAPFNTSAPLGLGLWAVFPGPKMAFALFVFGG